MSGPTTTVGKFGGTSVKDALMIRRVADIVHSTPDMKHVVVSAPEGVTNLLFAAIERSTRDGDSLLQVEKRFTEIVEGLDLSDFPLQSELEALRQYKAAFSRDELVSRGEYLCGKIFSAFTGFEFLDATQFIVLNDDGTLNLESTRRAWRGLDLSPEKRYVIPGFYGSLSDGRVKLFPRNSSDLSGSVVAVCAGARLFQKWTNVSGIRRAPPNMVPDAEKIDEITFQELRELTDQGSKVLYSPALFPLWEEGIPIEVKNTEKPDEPGTMVLPDGLIKNKPLGSIVGISSRKDFTVITVEKALMGRGYAVRVLAVFDQLGLDIAHITDGVDVLSLTVASEYLQNGKQGELYSELRRTCKPDRLNVKQGVAIIAVVGHWMHGAIGTASKIFAALAEKGINLEIVGQSASQTSVVIGVENTQCERAVAAIYDAVVRNP